MSEKEMKRQLGLVIKAAEEVILIRLDNEKSFADIFDDVLLLAIDDVLVPTMLFGEVDEFIDLLFVVVDVNKEPGLCVLDMKEKPFFEVLWSENCFRIDKRRNLRIVKGDANGFEISEFVAFFGAVICSCEANGEGHLMKNWIEHVKQPKIIFVVNDQ